MLSICVHREQMNQIKTDKGRMSPYGEIEVKNWPQVGDKNKVKSQIEEVFFLCSSRTDFKNQKEKGEFLEKWTGYYWKSEISNIYIALNKKDQNVLGYLMGCPNSCQALDFYSDKNKSYAVFEDLFTKFPAHLHINCHPVSQGMGVGQLLIQKFFHDLKFQNVQGVHIITSKEARNVSFYQRMGMDYSELRTWKGHELYFMGKTLA